jgi:GT2 family glycosyltransferase
VSTDRSRIGGIIVVDNGSVDGSPDRVATAFPSVQLLRSRDNLGFAGGNNLALADCRSSYVFLLNNDTEVADPRFVTTLCEVLDASPSIAAAGPALVLPDGRYQTGAAGQDGSLLSFASYFLFLSRLLPSLFRPFYLDQSRYATERSPIPVDWVSGAAMMVRREQVVRAGGVPDDYFMYAEDVKLCRSLRRQGCSVYYVPFARVLHHHGTSENAAGVKTRWIDSTLQEYRARAGALKGSIAAATFSLGFFLRAGIYAIAGLSRDRQRLLPASRRMTIYGRAAWRAVGRVAAE